MGYIGDGRDLIGFASKQGLALPAFNVCSVEMVRGCLEAAGEMRAPIILQTYPADIEQVPPAAMTALVRVFAESVSVRVPEPRSRVELRDGDDVPARWLRLSDV